MSEKTQDINLSKSDMSSQYPFASDGDKKNNNFSAATIILVFLALTQSAFILFGIVNFNQKIDTLSELLGNLSGNLDQSLKNLNTRLIEMSADHHNLLDLTHTIEKKITIPVVKSVESVSKNHASSTEEPSKKKKSKKKKHSKH